MDASDKHRVAPETFACAHKIARVQRSSGDTNAVKGCLTFSDADKKSAVTQGCPIDTCPEGHVTLSRWTSLPPLGMSPSVVRMSCKRTLFITTTLSEGGATEEIHECPGRSWGQALPLGWMPRAARVVARSFRRGLRSHARRAAQKAAWNNVSFLFSFASSSYAHGTAV